MNFDKIFNLERSATYLLNMVSVRFGLPFFWVRFLYLPNPSNIKFWRCLCPIIELLEDFLHAIFVSTKSN